MPGPLAFPQPMVNRDGHVVAADEYADHYGGMELRDYFAGQAIVGILMQQTNVAAMKAILEGVGIEVHAAVGAAAYAYADAMLAARAKGGER
jgi:hypothetical protein